MRMPASLAASFVAAGVVAGAALGGPKLFVGVAEDGLRSEPTAAVRDARKLGIEAFRITFFWSPHQSRLTRRQARELRRAVRAAKGMRVVVAVYADAARNAPVTRERRERFCRFLRDALAREPRVRDVVVWNEPNTSYFWRPQFDAAGRSAAPVAYEALLARCWDVLHRFRADMNLIAPATSPRGNDNPAAVSNISHSPTTFIRRMGEAYRKSGRRRPIFDTVGHHVHGTYAAEPPSQEHGGTTIGQGDAERLVSVLAEAFAGTAQPTPGRCVRGRCASIWYLEAGFQTSPDRRKRDAYTGNENVRPVPDYVAPASRGQAERGVRDQATQVVRGITLAYCQPYVEAYFNFLLWDEQRLEGWQSAPFWADRTPKHSYAAFRRAIAAVENEEVTCAREGARGATPTPSSGASMPSPSRVARERRGGDGGAKAPPRTPRHDGGTVDYTEEQRAAPRRPADRDERTTAFLVGVAVALGAAAVAVLVLRARAR